MHARRPGAPRGTPGPEGAAAEDGQVVAARLAEEAGAKVVVALVLAIAMAMHYRKRAQKVTDERVRYAHGDVESGGVSQWRWQTKTKFANDAVKEVNLEETTAPAALRTKSGEKDTGEQTSPSPRASSSGREILSKRK